jgi:hypothetical protein
MCGMLMLAGGAVTCWAVLLTAAGGLRLTASGNFSKGSCSPCDACSFRT